MEITASTSCLIVWAVLSLAYIRYVRWLKLCDEGLQDEFAKYRRSDPNYTVWTLFSFIQPVPAYIGLIGSLLTVCVFTSVPWWNGTFSGQKFAIAYAGPIMIVLLWLFLKVIRWYFLHGDGVPLRWWVPLDNNAVRLQRCIADLTWQELEPGPRRRDSWPQQLRATFRRRKKPANDPDPCSRVSHHYSNELNSLPNGALDGHPQRRPSGNSSQHDSSAREMRPINTSHLELESARA